MPRPLVWTPLRDAEMRRMRADGAPWDAIAAALGISRWAAIEHGRAIGARAPARTPRRRHGLASPGRDPLPAGHPASWNTLTAGTLLDGTAYPWPPLGVVGP